MQPDISRLIRKIRDTGFAVEAWRDTLNLLTDALGVAGAACIISNRRTGRVDWACLSGPSAKLQPNYINHYAPLDPLIPLLNVGLGWTKLSECLPNSVLRKSEWYNDFVLSSGIRDILGARVLETPSHFVTFGFHVQIGRYFSDKTTAIVDELAGPLGFAALRHIRELFGPKAGETEADIDGDGLLYYFHVQNGKQYPDEIGGAFPSRQAAVAHGAVLAAELAQDGDWEGFMISVTDVNGRVIVQIPVRR